MMREIDKQPRRARRDGQQQRQIQKTGLNETNTKDENDETDAKRRAGGAFQRGFEKVFSTLWRGAERPEAAIVGVASIAKVGS